MMMQRALAAILLTSVLVLVTSPPLPAQCAMCKASVEGDQAAGGNLGTGLNASILFMLGLPYVLVGAGAVLIYRAGKKKPSA